MEVVLLREYFPDGTNGKFVVDGKVICRSIELPWLQNRRNVSCIPEGYYQIQKRHTAQLGFHLFLPYVPDRDGILIHPANDALKELKGCIAPVSRLTGPGKGSASKVATEKLQNLLFEALDNGEEVHLTIIKSNEMKLIDRVKAPTPKFFKKLRNAGMVLAAAGAALLAAPVTLPAGVITLAGYLVTAGSVLTAVSQTTVSDSQNGATS